MTEHTTFSKGDHVEYLGCFTEGRPGVLLTSAPDDAPETTVLVNWDNGGQESVKIGALRNVTPTIPTTAMPTVPRVIGSDQESAEGITVSLIAADIDDTRDPRRIAIDLADNSGIRPDSSELGWFDVETMVRNLAEFAPALVVLRREDLPEVTITQHDTEPTTCTVDIGGVRCFSGADWTGHAVNAQYLHDQLTETRMKLATAEDEAGDLRARWAAYATALARLEDTTKPQVIGKHVVMRHETLTQLETECDQLANSNVTTDQLDQERRDHEETRRELRAMTAHARKWQRFAAVIELMEDANQAELIIDGVRITPVAGVRTKATKE